MLRVIAGSAKGRQLDTLRTLALRPTPDRVREALFNILGARIIGTAVLDLFAGSGAIGLEALSRGAQQATFVEIHEPACRLIAHNLQRCGLYAQATIYCRDVLQAIATLATRQQQFEVIFLDPPYQTPLLERALQQLGTRELLSETGQVIAEHFFKRALPEQIGRLQRARVVRFGDVALSFYRERNADVEVDV